MIHHVYANRSNAGDWLSAIGIQKLLAPLPVKEYLCDEPFVPETIASLSEVPEGDLVVIGGGGLFMDYFRGFWEGFVPLVPSLRYCLWGLGYCDLKREASRPPSDLLRLVVEGARLCVVRDELTRTHLSEAPGIEVVACPSIVSVERPDAPGSGVLHVANYTTVGADEYEVMRARGMAFAARTGRGFWETNNRMEPDDRARLEQVVARYGKVDVVVSSALHGCILGVAMGARVVAVSGDRKIEAFMEAVGLEDWVLDFTEVDRLDERLERLDEQRIPAEFVARAGASNAAVARRVKELAGADSATVA